MGKLTLKRAKELSILKWKELAKTGDSFLPEEFETEVLAECTAFNCGFCEYQYQVTGQEGGAKCDGCRLLISESINGDDMCENICCDGLYKQWVCSSTKEARIETSGRILALIESIEVE